MAGYRVKIGRHPSYRKQSKPRDILELAEMMSSGRQAWMARWGGDYGEVLGVKYLSQSRRFWNDCSGRSWRYRRERWLWADHRQAPVMSTRKRAAEWQEVDMTAREPNQLPRDKIGGSRVRRSFAPTIQSPVSQPRRTNTEQRVKETSRTETSCLHIKSNPGTRKSQRRPAVTASNTPSSTSPAGSSVHQHHQQNPELHTPHFIHSRNPVK